MFKLYAAMLVVLLLSGCGAGSNTTVNSTSAQAREPRILQNAMTVPGQRLPPESIRSIQLFRGSPGNAPIVRLSGGDRLTLRFDELARERSMFRVEITHHNADWSQSNLLPNLFMRGYMQDFIHDGQSGRFQNPMWFAYEYTFPNNQMGVRYSGNYMMHIYNQETNAYVFSMPFLVEESVNGELSTTLEELYNLDSRILRHHQLFARYTYDDPGLMPQTDLRIFFVQNQFWSLAREANQQDLSEAGVARMYLSRDRSFAGTFEFMDLDLAQIDQYSLQVIDFDQNQRIPQLTLMPDVVNLGFSASHRSINRLSSPSTRNDARYALVRFQLEIPANDIPSDPIYVVGGFNNWGIQPHNRLRWDDQQRLFTGTAIVKEGHYTYKYVTSDGNSVDLTRLDASFASTRQEYHTLIYLRDQALQIDRLVGVNRFLSPN